MTERRYSVTIMASRRNGTLYVGVTNHLGARAFQHRNGAGSQFTAKYGVKTLVFTSITAMSGRRSRGKSS